MPRPPIRRRIRFDPKIRYFKPQGVPARVLREVCLQHDELEALRLHDLESLEQTEAAQKMGISQSTFSRILDSAYKKVADAILNGKALRIEIDE